MRNLVSEAIYRIIVLGLTQEGLRGSLFKANLAEQVPKKSFKELTIERPYYKPTQVDKRKYAKVNG